MAFWLTAQQFLQDRCDLLEMRTPQPEADSLVGCMLDVTSFEAIVAGHSQAENPLAQVRQFDMAEIGLFH